MSYTVTIVAGLKDVVLPNGSRYQGGDTAVLSDAEYGRLSPGALAGIVTGPAATEVSVASSATSVTLFAAATGPVEGRTIYNDSTAVLYVKFGTTASTSSYEVQIAAGGFYTFPAPVYSGRVDGIWASANGNARLTSW